MIYLIPLFILLIFAINCEYNVTPDPSRNKPIVYVFLSYIGVLMAFRYRLSLDTINYMEVYHLVKPLNKLSFVEVFEQYEPLNIFLKSLAKNISDEFYVYQIFHSIILNILISRFIVKNTKYVLFALFFYFLLTALYFNAAIMRESLAIAVFINAYSYIEKKKWLRYYLCCFIALGFHTSALITFIIPLFRNLKFNWFYCLGLIVFVGAIGYFQNQLTFVAEYLDPEARRKLLGYLTGDRFNIYWIIVQLINKAAFPFLFFILYKNIKRSFKYESMILVNIAMGIGSIFLQIIFQRLANYFIMFYILMLAELLPLYKVSKNRVVLMYVMCFFVFTIFYLYYFKSVDSSKMKDIPQYSSFYPYHSILFKEIDPVRERRHSIEFGY